MVRIYKDVEEFDARLDKKINGVTLGYLEDIGKTLEEVKASMRDCEGCFNCYDCTRCTDCTHCEHCTDCIECFFCEKRRGLKGSKFVF